MAAAASAQAVVAAGVEHVFATLATLDPSAGYYPAFGPLPGVQRVSEQTAVFTEPNASRRLHLSDGGSVVETVVVAEEPTRHSYELRGFERIFGRLVDHARADWRFDTVPGGTRIRWRYAFTALPGRAVPVWLIVRLLWAPYMRRVMPGIARSAGRLVG